MSPLRSRASQVAAGGAGRGMGAARPMVETLRPGGWGAARAVEAALLLAAAGFVTIFAYSALYGRFDVYLQRSLFTLFAVGLVFLHDTAQAVRSNRPWRAAAASLLLATSAVGIGYVSLNYQEVAYQAGIITKAQAVLAALALLVILEAARRTIGWTLPILAVLFLAYALLGGSVPGAWGHAGFSLDNLLGYLYTTPDGLWSLPVGVASTYILMFILFGEVLTQSGAAELINYGAMRIARRARAGPAQVAVLASAAFGTISGAAPANVAVTGSVTIPLMKRVGFPASLAGAVEAAASAGGQIMPPVMGAGAFLMAELLNVPYATIARAAAVPAVLYFLGVAVSVHLAAVRLGLRRLGPEDVASWFPDPAGLVRRHGHLLVPLVLLVYLILRGFSPVRAALYMALLALLQNVAVNRALNGRRWLETMRLVAVRVLPVATACAVAAVIYSVIVFTGLGVKFAGLAVELSGGSELALLLIVAVTCLILGLGLPTTAAYIIAAATAGPALEMVGIPAVAAHLFLFYFAVIGTVTPPLGLALYTAAGIAETAWLETGIQASKLTISGFLVPFAFVHAHGLLLEGPPGLAVLQVAATAAGILSLSLGVMGHPRWAESGWARLLLGACGALLIHPDLGLSAAGAAGLGLWLVLRGRRAAVA